MANTKKKNTKLEDLSPVVLGKDKVDIPDEDKVHLFSIDDKDYFINKKVPANVALRFHQAAQNNDPFQGASTMLRGILGKEAFTALMEYDDLTDEELKHVTRLAVHICFPDAEVTE